jgi:lipopolysaccharide transport system permease protein
MLSPELLELARTMPKTIIRPSRGWVALRLRDVWAYRELVLFLTWRDISVRYKQTLLGAAWAVLQPFLSMVVFSIFFGRLAAVPSDDLPYPLFSYAGLLPWQYFATAMASSSESLIASEKLITKVYFPRLVIPLAAVLPAVLDFSIAFVVLLGMMAFYGVAPTVNVVWLSLYLPLAVATALGVGLWLSAWNVQYRDFRYVIPFLTQFWLFASPVAYPSSIVPERLRALYGINPMVGVIEGFRWALLGSGTAPGLTTAVSALTALGLLVSGAFVFRRMEKSFADVI